MQCLVCDGEAKDLTKPYFDGRVIECPRCGKYEVLGCTWELLQNASVADRAAALSKATTLQGVARWPTIKTVNF